MISNVTSYTNYFTVSPSQELIKYTVRNFILSVRTLPSDPVIARNNLESSYHFLTSRGAAILNGLFQQENPVAEFGKKTRSLHVDTVLALSRDSYQAEWVEIEYDTDGNRTLAQLYRGVFSIINQPSSTEEEVRKNPLGIYIDNFSWSTALR